MNVKAVTTSHAHRPLPRHLKQFLLWSILLAAACLGTETVCALALHLQYPFNFPIFNPGAFAYDLLLFRGNFQHFHSQTFFTLANEPAFMYPAPVAIPYWIFLKFGRLTVPVFLLFCVFVVAISASKVRAALVRRGYSARSSSFFLLACFLLSYPFWFEIKDANMEIVVFAIIIVGVSSYLAGDAWLAALCFGLATALKIFPFVYLGLFLARKQYRQALFAILVAGLVNLASLWAVCPAVMFSARQTAANVAKFRLYAMLQLLIPEGAFDHSLFGCLKWLFPRTPSPQILSHWLNGYLLFAASAGVLIFFLRIIRLPVTNQILCLTVASILLPPFSSDYTLMHLYTPWVLLVLLSADASREGVRIPGMGAAFTCLILLCAPLSEFIYHGFTLEGRIKTFALLALFVIGVRYRFELRNEVQLGTVAT